MSGGQVVAIFHDAALNGEYIVAIIPYLLGHGIGLFPSIQREQSLSLKSAKTYLNGVIKLIYLKSSTQEES